MMWRKIAVVTGALALAACGSEDTEAKLEKAVVTGGASLIMSEITTPPDPCLVLTEQRARDELGVAARYAGAR